jgi:hypothetical protein
MATDEGPRTFKIIHLTRADYMLLTGVIMRPGWQDTVRSMVAPALAETKTPVPRGHCGRCDRCGWPLSTDRGGCRDDDCSLRPLPPPRNSCAGCNAPYVDTAAPLVAPAPAEALVRKSEVVEWLRLMSKLHTPNDLADKLAADDWRTAFPAAPPVGDLPAAGDDDGPIPCCNCGEELTVATAGTHACPDDQPTTPSVGDLPQGARVLAVAEQMFNCPTCDAVAGRPCVTVTDGDHRLTPHGPRAALAGRSAATPAAAQGALATPGDAAPTEKAAAWHHVAMVYGYNELTKTSKTLAEKVYFRMGRDQAEQWAAEAGVKIGRGDQGAVVLELTAAPPFITFHERDIELMREAVAAFDARAATPAAQRRPAREVARDAFIRLIGDEPDDGQTDREWLETMTEVLEADRGGGS